MFKTARNTTKTVLSPIGFWSEGNLAMFANAGENNMLFIMFSLMRMNIDQVHDEVKS